MGEKGWDRPDGGRGAGGAFLIVTVDSFLERRKEVSRLWEDVIVVRHDDSAGRPHQNPTAPINLKSLVFVRTSGTSR